MAKALTNASLYSIFATWFFHNSIRFKVNKVWLGLVVRQALIVYRGFFSFISLFLLDIFIFAL